ncbi:MAG: hypothetical protein WCR21_07920 [Bacteroidota bacterium]
MKKILVIGDHGPAEFFAGGAVMKEMFQYLYSNFEIDLIVFNSFPFPYTFQLPSESTLKVRSKMAERQPNFKGSFTRAVSGYLIEYFMIKPWIKKNKELIEKQLVNLNYDKVLIFLQGQIMPRLVSELNFGVLPVFNTGIRINGMLKITIFQNIKKINCCLLYVKLNHAQIQIF